MYDIKWIRENAEAFNRGLTSRGAQPLSDFLLQLDGVRREAVAILQDAQEQRNTAASEIGQFIAKKDFLAADARKIKASHLKDVINNLEVARVQADGALEAALAAIPNMPQADVPVGSDEHGNVIRSVQGNRPEMAFAPKEHWELGEALGMMDFETAAKLSGSRFVVLKGGLARLERALGQFFLDTHTQPEKDGLHGYAEVTPPLLVRDAAMFGTAQLPKFADDQFRALKTSTIEERLKWHDKKVELERLKGDGRTIVRDFDEAPRFDEHWLIPTAEVPLTNLVSGKILAEAELPIRVTALTPCFRAEAGSAGRDTKGMLRQHQFSKVELVSITKPEDSNAEHERMLACAEAVLRALGLHYRVMTLCTGDMGFASTKTFDIEVWLPGQNTYREISSCSNCGDFQARRMNARVRGADGKSLAHVHTLNGSGVAVGRALIAVMENYQNADGSITVPEALRPYMGGVTRIARA
jgi:seryl-tRNA synthetase